jgi:hypothetical protein
MSDELRARRSIQEKKAGRWTDGSIRMDKLWHGFHWVLPDEDWKNKAWRQLIREVDGKDIWEKKESSED